MPAKKHEVRWRHPKRTGGVPCDTLWTWAQNSVNSLWWASFLRTENMKFRKPWMEKWYLLLSTLNKIEQNRMTMTMKHSLSNEMGKSLSASSQRGHIWQDQREHRGWLLVGHKCAFMDGLAFSGAWHSLMASTKSASSAETNRLWSHFWSKACFSSLCRISANFWSQH